MNKFQRLVITWLFAADMFISMLPWFMLKIGGNSKYILIFVLSSILFFTSPYLYKSRRGAAGMMVFFVIAAFTGVYGNIFSYIGRLITILPFTLFLLLPYEMRNNIIDAFRKLFLLCISISLPFWIIHLFGVEMPHNTIYIEGNTEYIYLNYYFFVHGIAIEDFFPRFCSIFIEPGYIACFDVLFIYLDRYNFRKWYNWILLFALFLSFSLAGWILFVLGMIPFLLDKKNVKRILVLASLLLVVSTIVYYLDKDDVVYEMIGSRLEFEDGEMKGYNRASKELDYIWENRFLNGDNMLTGMREQSEQYDFGHSVDMRMYLVRFGLLAGIAYVFFLLMCFLNNKSKQGLWFAILVLLFVYRGYTVMFFDALLFLYLAGLERMKRDSLKIKFI